jgi:6,7-dimethyl-8-ribityllumazine synthase
MKKKILIVTANYYKNISKGLILSAKKILQEPFDLIFVPGVFEIPVIISRNIKKYDGFIALGCVIKGETPHFEFISRATIDAIMKLSIQYKKPIGNGIITCLNQKQALVRQKKGREAAAAMLSVLNSIKNSSK